MTATNMPKLSVNLSIMFQEVPFVEHRAAATKTGCKAVEFMFPYSSAISDLHKEITGGGLSQALINTPVGNFSASERGIAVDFGRQARYRESVLSTVNNALALKVDGSGNDDHSAIIKYYENSPKSKPGEKADATETGAEIRTGSGFVHVSVAT